MWSIVGHYGCSDGEDARKRDQDERGTELCHSHARASGNWWLLALNRDAHDCPSTWLAEDT